MITISVFMLPEIAWVLTGSGANYKGALHHVQTDQGHLACLANRSWSRNLGPVVQSVVSLTSSLRVISLTVLANSIHNILIIFAEKM